MAAAAPPQLTALSAGRIITLRSWCTGLNLAVADEKTLSVNGKGLNATDASRWVVRVVPEADNTFTIQLESYKCPGRFLRINPDKKLDANGHSGGEYTHFRVTPYTDNMHFALYSKVHHEKYKNGQFYVAVNPGNYEPKDVATTKFSGHAFWKASYEPNLEWRSGGKIVCLQSMASGAPGKTLRLIDGSKTYDVDANGDTGAFSQWKVNVMGHELYHAPLVQLESVKEPGKFLRVDPDIKLNANGHKDGEYTYFHVDPHEDGTISLRNLAYNIKFEHAYHVGALPDGSVKAPNQTGTGPHGKWRAIWIN